MKALALLATGARSPFGRTGFLAMALCALAGCSSADQFTPTAALAVTTAYNDVRAALPALGPVSATMNSDGKNAYAQAQTICAAGAPTNGIAAGVDILAVENALLPYFSKAQALAADRHLAHRRLHIADFTSANEPRRPGAG